MFCEKHILCILDPSVASLYRMEHLKEALPWVVGATLVVVAVGLLLWWTTPEENALPEIYEVM